MTRRIGRLLASAAALVLVALPLWCGAVDDTVPVPKLTGRVVDLTGTLSANERAALEEKLRAFEQAKGSQIAVLLVPSIGTETIEEFAGRVTDAWQLGRKGVDDGVLFVVAKQERKMRIHTGRGVQGTLTDALSKRIVADLVAPRFRSGDFAGGIDDGVGAVMKAIEGEDLPLPAKKPRGKVESQSSNMDFIWVVFLGVPILAMILRSVFGRLFGAGITSGLTGVGAWLLFGSLAFGIVAALIAFLFTLLSGAGGARAARPGGFGGWIPGGFSSGGGSWSGGGGGFSGGGGSFDGGGASGDW